MNKTILRLAIARDKIAPFNFPAHTIIAFNAAQICRQLRPNLLRYNQPAQNEVLRTLLACRGNTATFINEKNMHTYASCSESKKVRLGSGFGFLGRGFFALGHGQVLHVEGIIIMPPFAFREHSAGDFLHREVGEALSAALEGRA